MVYEAYLLFKATEEARVREEESSYDAYTDLVAIEVQPQEYKHQNRPFWV
jgi:hypothetical protein